MDFEKGFRIESPDLWIPYGIDPAALETCLQGNSKKVSEKYYVFPCTALSGLQMSLGLHFIATKWGMRLNEFEVFFEDNEDFDALFPLRQKHLELTLGNAGSVQDTKMKGFRFYKWEIGTTTVEHFLRDRFGLEEHISFVNNDCADEGFEPPGIGA